MADVRRVEHRARMIAHRAALAAAGGVSFDPVHHPLLKRRARGSAGCWRRLSSGQTIDAKLARDQARRSEEHTSELQSLMRISYAVFCLKKKNYKVINNNFKTNLRK